jgi:hypothetical protein
MVVHWFLELKMEKLEISGRWPVETCSGDFQPSAALARWFSNKHT